jgi:hypothetical protein
VIALHAFVPGCAVGRIAYVDLVVLSIMTDIGASEKSGKKDSLLRKPSGDNSSDRLEDVRKKEITFAKDPVKQTKGD